MTIKERLSSSQKRRFYKILDKLPDRIAIELQHYAAMGRRVNLKNPKRFTDKIQWYKLNYRNDLMTIVADKYRIREYIESKNLTHYLPKLYDVIESYEELDFDSLPSSFAIKLNNGSGTNIFVKNKNKVNKNRIEKEMASWNKVNTLSIGREWAYENIEPKIVVEELLLPNDKFQQEYGLNDFKIMCFNGKAELIWLDTKRYVNHSRDFYSLDWEKLEILSDKPNSDSAFQKPENLKTMIEIAENFAKDFPFVRVDFYEVNGNVYIGELTFYPWSGTVKFTPDRIDFEFGDLFKLPR